MNDKDTEFNHLWHRLNAVEQGVTFGRVWARDLRRRLRTAVESWLWPGAVRRRSWQFALPRPVRPRSWQFALPRPVVIGGMGALGGIESIGVRGF